MRYEDTSGAFQASGPVANDDQDTLTAGQRGPATGNLITGEGTQYGSAGADSAAGAHITGIAGQGGEDGSFSGGRLSVTGAYGQLSVDAEGNYSYLANKGAPENVRDRFTYTLADNQGNTDTAALIVEIGKTPAVIKANATQIVPGPDGVVTLPPGVELSDIMVVGRNLVVNMPDGTQLIIIDGAVFVPQLSLGGVDVPSTNVAALLIGQEPQPAAGELPPSSGGNFALPPPPLDPGVPLGDLIPPTEYNYIPPEPQPTFPVENKLPIDFGNLDILIDDDTLPAGLAGGPGDGPDAVNIHGLLSTLSLADIGGDGPLTFSLEMTGAPAGFALVSGGPGIALLTQNGVTVRTITFDPATGQYDVTQNAPILHPAGGQENNLVFVLTVTATDQDGDTAHGTITITYNDDTPEATNAQVGGTVDEDGVPGGIPGGTDDVAGESTVVNGSVTGLFLAGADGPLTYGLSSNTSGLPSLTSHGVAVTYAVAGDTLTASAGGTAVFTLVVHADGSYTFTLLDQLDHPTLNGQPGDDTENDLSLALGSVVQATDVDGDPVTAPANGLVIVVDDDTPLIGRADISAPHLTVDETNLAQNASGDFSVLFNGNVGADAPGAMHFAVSTVNGTDSGLVDVATGQSILLFNNNGVVEGHVGSQNGALAFTVSVNGTTGVVALDQVRAVEHPDTSNPDDAVSPNAGSIQLVASMVDADGDAASLTVNIGQSMVFEDDGPTVNPTLNANATVTVDESLPSGTPGIDTGAIVKGDDPDLSGGLAIGQANSGSAIVNANAVFGADGPAAGGGIGYALSISNSNPGVTLTDGTTITMQLVNGVIVGVVDAGAFAGQAAFAIAINASTGVVTVEQYLSLDHPVNPDPNDPLSLGDNSVAVTVTATDGDGDSITSGAVDISHQITFLDDGPTINPTLNAEATVTVDESLPSTVPTLDTGGIAKGDDPDLAGGQALGFGTSGSAVVDAAAVFGADGPQGQGGLTYALSILGVSSGVTLTDGSAINLQLVGGVIVGVVASGAFAGQAAFAIAIDANSGVVTVEQYLSLDHPVNPDPNDPLGLGDSTVGVTVTGTDGDGDPVTSNAIDISQQITFLDDGPSADPVLEQEAIAQVDESLPSTAPAIDTLAVAKGDDPDLAGGLAIGQGNSGSAIIDVNAIFGADGPAAGGGISYALSVLNASSGLTLTDGSAINLQLLANGVVVGVVASGAFAGQAAFAVAINSTTGVVSVEQYLSLDHPINPDPNDVLHLGDNTLGVTATVTDGDGDSITTDAVDISNNLSFFDDGPTVDPVVNVNATVTVDETPPSSAPAIDTGIYAKGDDPDLSGGLAIGQANSGSAIVNANAVFGADGPAATNSLTYALSILNISSGLTLTDGSAVNLVMQGGVIVGVVSGGAFNGQAAFAIAINSSTGVVSVEQYLSLDHPINPDPNDPLSFGVDVVGVTVTATDGDNDPVTSDAVDIGGQLTFLDDGPSAQNDVDVIVGGNGPATGNVITGVDFGGGDANATDGTADSLGADGIGAITHIASNNVPGNVDTDPGANFVIAGQYGTLTLLANGNYSYVRTTAVGGVQDVFTYTVTDGDGDPVTATLTISIQDNFPNLPDPTLVQLDDDALAGGNPGGTGDDPDSAGLPGQLSGTGGDAPLTYNFTGDDTVPAGFTVNPLNATTVQILQGATVVLTVTLNQATGAFNVVQNHAIDHPAGSNENNLQFSIGVEVEDVDGDVEPAHINIDVDDDTPTVSANATVQLDDDALAGGNPGGTGDDANATNTSGTLAHSYGADGAGSIVYLTTGAPAGFSYSLQGNGDLWVLQGATHVLTLTVNATTGAYLVTQVAPIDHAAGNDENNALFTVNYRVTDHDGDTVDGSIVVNVDDDTPTISANAAVQLDDDALAGGIAGGTGDVNPDTANTSGTLGHSYGADGAGSTAYLTTGAPAGFSYALQGNGDLWIMQGATHVITLTVNASTGAYNVVQVAPINHPAGSDENDVAFTVTYRVTDHDGDTADGSIVINVDDDTPTATVVTTGQAVSVDESVGIQVDSNDTTNAGVIALFATVANPGTDTDLPQYAQNASAIVASTGSAYGADGAGTTVFSLNVSAAGVDSGLNTTGGQDILLFKEGALVVGRVSGGADDGKAAFAIAIDPSTGVISMVEYLSIQHPIAANADDMVSIANGAVLAVVTVTDADSDPATNSVAIGSQLQFQDSGPVMTAAQNMNIQNSGDVAHTGQFAFNLGADGANASNDVITNVTGSATVGGVAVTGWSLTPVSENATTASYSFQFDYPIGGGNTAHETGTLVFDKVAGTYTIDLLNPIQGVTTILQTATGTLFQGYEPGTSTVDGSQPAISVTQIQDLAGTANDIYVQFTSVAEPSSGTGDNNLEFSNWVPGANNPDPVSPGGDTTWNPGQVFNQTDSWVSTSNDANGVAGDTIQGGEVLDFSLVQGPNPTGVLAAPSTYAQATSMFLKFDGIGTGEDMIVLVKVYDTVLHTYSTVALMVQNSDIQKGPGSGPGIYSNVTLDQNDGLIVIEPNDYQQGNTNLVIVGAQIAGSDEGLSGTALDFTYGGVLGVASTGNQDFSVDVNDGPFKISSIGFTTVSTTPQNAQLDFNVTVTDGDGDSITQAISATVTPAADSTSAATIPAANTTVAPVVLDLNGDGVQFLGADAGVHYNYGDGSVATGWVGPDDGMLVRDANGNGTVDGAGEFVFGSGGQTDMQALAAQYGSALNAGDADYAKFGVWQDANSNGAVDAGEYQTLAAAGIVSINLVSDGVSYSAAGGDVNVAGSSIYTNSDGSTGIAADAAFWTGGRAASDEQRALTGSTSNIALAAAVAAVGLTHSYAAAANPAFSEMTFDSSVHQTFQTVNLNGDGRAAFEDSVSRLSLGNESIEPAFNAVSLSNSNHSFNDNSFGSHGLEAISFGNAAPAYVPHFAANEAMASSGAAFTMAPS
ncbi:MAG: DUF5801 repeats-in-toxin domain-containing protein, partial [Sphingomicrobium sp.]